MWTVVRHTVGRCLMFPALEVTWSVWTNHKPRCVRSTLALKLSVSPPYYPIKSIANKIGSFQFLPTGLHGLCFGCCFSGPLPLRSLIKGPPIGVRFQESLVVRLYAEIDQIHLSIEAQCVTTLLPLGDCHRSHL